MKNQLLNITIFCILLMVTGIINSHAAPAPSKAFDHFNTGFPLTGRHVSVACESCHIKAIFKGTPTACNGCHNAGIAPGKHPKHIISDDNCDNCHTTFSWQQAAMDHNSVLGSCMSCHNGTVAKGKPPRHVVTNAGCDDCHGTVSWVPARFDHSNIIGRCDSCHNGRDATGKHATHLATTQDCGECHTTTTFAGGSFNHTNITGRCDSCHNGRDATGKTPNHIVTSQDCGDCHNTNTFITGSFNHDNIGGRRCDSCHNGVTATGKPPQHILTNEDCGTCHVTTTWIVANFDHSLVSGACSTCHLALKSPSHFNTSRECNYCHLTTGSWNTIQFVHSSASYPGDHTVIARDNCVACHTSNSEVVNWPFAAYQPDCAGCHANKWPGGDKHKHLVNGATVLYTLAELANCAGSCHKEAEFISQHHRTTNSGW